MAHIHHGPAALHRNDGYRDSDPVVQKKEIIRKVINYEHLAPAFEKIHK